MDVLVKCTAADENRDQHEAGRNRSNQVFDRVGSHYWAVRRATAPIRHWWLDTTLVDVGNVPDDGPVILAANHLSFLDSPLLMFGLDRQVTMLGKAEYLQGWATRRLFPSAGMIPVDRSGRGLVESLRRAERVLTTDGVVGIFPEGTRSRTGDLYRGRSGVAHLALKTGAPIVPVGIIGSDAVQSPDSRLPRFRGRVELRFGSPIDMGPWVDRPKNADTKTEITGAVMRSIAALSGQYYRDEFAPIPTTDPAAPLPDSMLHPAFG
ncbi:MAG: lysophospholipid acyltransferase family protein [Acidimicrobiales bacterium]